MIGMNIFEISLLNMYFKDWKMERMVMSLKLNGIFYLMNQILFDKMKLFIFSWFDYVCFLSKEDIFNWRGKKVGEVLCKIECKVISGLKCEIINMKQLWECLMYESCVDLIINIFMWMRGKKNW